MTIGITQFGMRPHGGNGARICSFDRGDVRVTVEASGGGDASDDDRVMATARDLAADAERAAHRDNVERSAIERIAELTRDLAAARAALPPKSPARLMNVGTVRFDNRGGMWLLSKRESGWSAFGVWLDGWDDLFRRYAVIVTGHGTDDHGMWWSVENNPKERI